MVRRGAVKEKAGRISSPKRIVIAGYYGFGNAGDEMILQALLADASSVIDGPRFTVISGDPSATAAAFNVKAVRFTDLPAVIDAIRDSDVVILGGGGLFHDYWGVDDETLLTPGHGGVSFYAGVALLATVLDKPLVIYGVGVGPLHSARAKQLTKVAFDQAVLATVRDETSRRELVEAGVDAASFTVTADPAFNLQPSHEQTRAAISNNVARPVIGAALRNWNVGVTPEQWEREIAHGLDLFVDRSEGTVAFIPFQNLQGALEDDVAVCRRVLERMHRKANALLLDVPTIADKAAAIAACDVVIAMRLHALVLSVQEGIAAVPIVYDPKIDDLSRRAGLQSLALEVGSLHAADLVERISLALSRKKEIQRSEEQVVKQMKSAAATNVRLMQSALASRSPRKLSLTTTEVLKRAVLSLSLVLGKEVEEADLLRKRVSSRDDDLGNLQANLAGKIEEISGALEAGAEYGRSLERSLQEKDKQIEEINREAERGAEDLGRARAVSTALQAENEQLSSDVRDLTAHLQIRETQAATLEAHAATQAEGIEWLRNEVAIREAWLEKIYGSRMWRTADIYWRNRRLALRLAKPLRVSPKEVALRVGRRILPRSIKRYLKRFWDPNQRLRPKEAALLQSFSAPALGRPSALASTYDVICFSIIDWSFRWQRPQQIMARFAREGHRVFFLSTTEFLPPGEKRIAVTPLRENVWELKIATPFPLDVYGGELRPDFAEYIAEDLDQLRREFNINCAVSFVQVATWAPATYEARRRFGWKIVYDCMDEWNTFPGMKKPLLVAEQELVRETDLLVVSAQRLVEKWRRDRPDLVLARNAADFDHYSAVAPNDLLADVPHPIVGYFGAIADWFDLPLMLRLAKERPEYSFVLIGGVFNVPLNELQKLPNVRILGQKPYELMPSYLLHFDVCIIPFLVNAVTEATDPVKFYEYISMGKPVVAPHMPELFTYRDDLYIANDYEDFLLKVDLAVREDDSRLRERRIELARRNTWTARVGHIKEGIRQAHEKVSIVAVTYNNLDYTKLCIDSVFRNTLVPNFELIIVDNASNDGTPEYLKELAARHDNVKVILNERNHGFARANNQGVSGSAGSTIVLLNNDTVVPNGWLPKLLRHLSRPDLGLIVPVTNFSGNESRITVPYTDLRDLEDFAAGYTLEHEGELFDIRVAAMYCVAMRRDVHDKVGPLDEQFSVGMFEDDDYSERVRRAGYRVVCVEDVYIHHFGQVSFRKLTNSEYQAIWERNQKLYEKKWGVTWKPHTLRAGVR